MIAGQKHIIEKVYLEVNTTSENSAYYIKNNVDSFLKDNLLLKIEELINRYDLEDKIFRFDKIVLDISIQEWDNKLDITGELIKQLNKKIIYSKIGDKKIPGQTFRTETLHNESKLQSLKKTKNEEEIFLFFLENGFLPWYGNAQQIASFTENKSWRKSFRNPIFKASLNHLLFENKVLFVRFFYQFPIEMIVTFITSVNPRLLRKKTRILEVLAPIQINIQLEFIYTLYNISVEEKRDRIILVIQQWFNILRQNRKAIDANSKDFLPEICKLLFNAIPESYFSDEKFQKMMNDNLAFISKDKFPEKEYLIQKEDKEEPEVYILEKIKTEVDSSKQFINKDMQEIAVHNAGIIILHPFLNHFFTLLEIVNKQGNIVPSRRELAVQTLHFMAAGNEDFFEGELVLEKFLCGLPLHFPIQKKSLLTSEIKSEAENLLKHVIKNWPVLKNTSPEGLRQGFLQRDGKLIRKENNYKLIIERKALDILLEKLFWNISVIELKWISQILFVYW